MDVTLSLDTNPCAWGDIKNPGRLLNFSLTLSYMRVNRNEVVVETENGLVEGRRTHTKWERDIASFMGIPYAAPPVGELRWRPPQPRSNWRGVLKCLKYSNDVG